MCNWNRLGKTIAYRKKYGHEAKSASEDEGDEGEVPEGGNINKSAFGRW